jgi:hypothetical protein
MVIMGYMTDNHKGGRPRTRDRVKIAADLVEWAKKDENINLNGFCCEYEPPFSPQVLYEWAEEKDAEGWLITESMRIAKAFLAKRREIKLNDGTLHSKAYDKNATAYDYIMKKDLQEQMEFESTLKQREMKSVSQADVERFESVMGQLSSLRKDRSNADSSMSDEAKS